MSWRADWKDRRADVWTLLSDTDRFLSRARLLPKYDRRLRLWRRRLHENPGNIDVVSVIHDEIVEVRRSLRAQGYELKLGSIDVAIKGFRSDDSMNRGFRRMVLFLTSTGDILHLVGDANHVELDRVLRKRVSVTGVRVSRAHYLWYRYSAGVIELAGADSESAEDLQALTEVVEFRKSDFVRALKRLV